MTADSLYDLLKPLSDAGREIASQQQGLADRSSATHSSAQMDSQDVLVIKAFAEQTAAHVTIWQGMPQAGISLTDVTRCLNHAMSQDMQDSGVQAALIFSYLLKTPGCPVLSFLDVVTSSSLLKLHFGIRDQPDVVRAVVETLAHVTRHCSADDVDVARHSSETWEAVGALARHVVLKAPDKADYRAVATEAAVALMSQLPVMAQHQFVLFAARLARTAKVSQRLLAVELAPRLLQTFQDPFAPSSAMRLATPASLQASGAGAPESMAGSPARPSDEASAMDCDSPGSAPSTVLPAVPAECGPASTWGQVCIAMLIQRASDKAAAVRGRAISNLASIIEHWCAQTHGPMAASLAQFRQALSLGYAVRMQGGMPGRTPAIITPPFISPAGSDEPGATPMNDGTPECHTHPISTGPHLQRGGLHRQLLENAYQGAARAHALQLDVEVLVHMARRRCTDDKAAVRKAGLQLLEALLMMRARGAGGADVELPAEQDIRALEAATADALVTVRRTGLLAVSRLLRGLPNQTAVTELWVRAALPMARDVEASLQEQLLEQFHDLVLARAVTAGSAGRSQPALAAVTDAAALLRPILAVLPAAGAAGAACLGHACAALHAKKRLKGKAVATGLQRMMQQLNAQEGSNSGKEVFGAWMVMVEVSAQDPAAPSWEFLQESWNQLQQQGSGGEASASGGDGTLLLRVIANSAARFPAAQAAQLAADLLKAVEKFGLSPTAAAAHIAALAQLTASRGEVKVTDSAAASQKPPHATAWGSIVLQGAEGELGRFVEQVGDASLESEQERRHGMTSAEWRVATALFTAGEVALLRQGKASGRLVVLVQALTTPTLVAAAAADSQPAGSFVQGTDVPAVIQAHAWVALGKLCLTDEPLAKKCVPLFVQQLKAAKAPAVRNNIMVALADLCVQYTALVDTHLPRLAACLTDPDELVRRQALALLANLLQKDYVKWRGPLFHRFLLALVDDSPSVCALAEYLLTDTLASKAPLLAYNHFVEALFVLNDCRAGLHGGGSAALISDTDMAGATEGNLAQLTGSAPSARAKREAIYRALLQRMAPEHKFATAAKLCGEVLGGVADGLLPLHQCEEVLGDALRCLASKDIKVSTSKQAAGEEDDPAAVVGAAKGRLVSAMMKKHLVEGVVPVLIELKRNLEGLRHWLLGDLLTCIRALLKDHKTEIEDILVGDKQLAKEILYDMRQAELAKEDDAVTAALQGPAVQQSTWPQSADQAGPSGGGSPAVRAGPTAASPRPGLMPRGQAATRHRQSSLRRSSGSGAAGVSAQSPITAQVLAAAGKGQALRRKSRLQHVRAAESQASPSGLPRQATPGGAASQAEGLGQTPRGNGVALPGEGSTLRTGGGSVYMTPPTGSAQRPASRMRPNSPAVGGTPVSMPRLRQTAAKKTLLHAHSRAAAATGTGVSVQPETDENVDEANRPADVQLDSPSKTGCSKAKWNVQPSVVATVRGKQDASMVAVPAKQAGSNEIVTQTRRSTRSCKRKG
ncbi:hypothetical protein WJX79_003483 [Trebouxia sp. C0005]